MNLLKEIEAKIIENGKRAEYSHIAVSEVTAAKPTVGIWWYVKGRVLKVEELPENLKQEDMQCVSVEHNRTWPFVQKQYADELPEILTAGFNEVERGRVWLTSQLLDSTKKIFVITCSTSISKNPEAIQAIKSSFGLNGKLVKVEAHPGLYDREIKIK